MKKVKKGVRRKYTDTERLDAVIAGLIFYRTKYNSGWGAHFAKKHGIGAGTHFANCPREVIDAAIENKQEIHCHCCRGKNK